jgi:hypothetical protein
MKKLFLLIFIISTKLFSQNFQGRVEYETSYQVISEKENEASLKKDLGTKMTLTIKNGFYKEVTNSEYGNLYLYNPQENRLYFTDKVTPKILYYYEGNKEPNTKATYTVIKNAETILGHLCDKLIYQTDSYEIVYFYSKDLKSDPKYVKSFTYLNRNKKLEIMKAICLKQIITTKNFIGTMTAVKITPVEVSDEEFIKPYYTELIKQ